MPYGIPRVACCASLNLWTETHGVCGLPLSAYLTSELFMHTPHLVFYISNACDKMRQKYRKLNNPGVCKVFGMKLK